MHRVAAGTLDEAGWTLAKSTEGEFTVKLPLQFNDFTTIENNPAEPVKRTFVVGGERADGARFLAMRVEYRAGAQAAKLHFVGAKTMMERNGNLNESKELKFNKMPAWDATSCQLTTGCGSVRYVLAGDTIFMLVAEYPVAKREDFRAQLDTFFKSLKYQPLH